MNIEATLAILKDADPATGEGVIEFPHPDGGAYLNALQSRSSTMQTGTDQHQTTEALPPQRWRGPAIAVAVAAVLIAVIGATVLFFGFDRRSDVVDEPTESTVTESISIDVVLSAYDSLNSGDVDTWLGYFTDGAVIFGGTKQAAGNLYSVLSAANYSIEVIESCQPAARTQQGASRVECTIIEANDFHSAAGLTLTRSELFVVNGDGKITEATAAVIEFTQPGYYVFNQGFFDWLRAAHPNVHAEIGPQLTTHLPQLPQHMRTALEYLEEFLTQSDSYPISNGT